jgi:hypothetical protein
MPQGSALRMTFFAYVSDIVSVMAVRWLARLVAGFPQQRPGFEPRSGHVDLWWTKWHWAQVFFEYLGLPCQLSFHRLPHIYRHLSYGLVQ